MTTESNSRRTPEPRSGIGVWVGLIALLGVDAETGAFMLLYLDIAHEDARLASRRNHLKDLHKRIRPKFMTAAPMIGGIVTSFLLKLVIDPAIYEV